MGTISVSLPADGETIEAADYNTPITTIVNSHNGNIDNANIATNAAIDGTKLADTSITSSKIASATITGSNIASNTITASNIDFTTLLFGNFSTSEVDTGFKWVNGANIYKKTINFGTLPNTTFKNVAHGISGLSFVIHTFGNSYSGTTHRPLPFPGSNTNYISVTHDATNVTVTTVGDLTSYTTTYITLLYTK